MNLLKSICVLIGLLVYTSTGYTQHDQTIAFENGHWFTDDGFKQALFYSVNGTLTHRKPARIDTIINLRGGFVIPPFGEAHTHNLDRPYHVPALAEKYLEEGTFYVQLLTNKVEGAKKLSEYFNAHMGVTGTMGHPFMAYEPFALGYFRREEIEKNRETILNSRTEENNSYIFMDSVGKTEEKFPLLLENNPDVVKIYLLDTKNRRKRINDDIPGNHGLAPDVARRVVELAHRHNLPVYAHIETAYDFELATNIGVDYTAHMPGYAWNGDPAVKGKYYIPDRIIKQAVGQQVGVIPTLSLSPRRADGDSTRIQRIKEFQIDFVKRFTRAGGTIIIGADLWSQTLMKEIDYLYDLDVFNNLEMLKLISVTTPKAIFPKRKIGELREGYEASFLVLLKNPIEHFGAIKEIALRVKEGHILDM